MSLGYFGLGPDNFLVTRTKEILQAEIESYWSRTKYFLQAHAWSVNQVHIGQLGRPRQLTSAQVEVENKEILLKIV